MQAKTHVQSVAPAWQAKTREAPRARCTMMFDGEEITFARYGDDRHITKELKSHHKKEASKPM